MAKLKTQEQFEKELHEKYPQVEICGKYVNNATKIDFRCTIDDYHWSATPTVALKCGCSVCSGHYMNDYSFKQKVKERNQNVEVIGTYIDRKTPIKCKCLLCNEEFMGKYGSLMHGSTHDKCKGKLITLAKTKSQEWFEEKLNEKYPNEYDILGKYIKKKEPIKIRHRTCGYEWETTPDGLLSSKANRPTCPKCSGVYHYTDEEYKKLLAERNPTIIALEDYTSSHTKIKHKCLVCSHEWKTEPNSLINEQRGCPICKGGTNTVARGINDMWTTNPQLASLLANPEEGYILTQGMMKKTKFKCPNCGTISKPISIHKVKTRGFNCKCCSESRSLPNKIMYNLLSYLNVDFEDEKVFEWCKFDIEGKIKTGIYDFYLPSCNLIIEMDGKWHYKDNPLSNQNLNISQFIDDEKDRLALEHGLNIVRIDCNVSEIDYIKNSIINSDLVKYLVLDNVDWEYCYYHTIPNHMKEIWQEYNDGIKIMDLARKYNKDYGTISKYLKIGTKFGCCSYTADGYHTEVICLDTLKIYNKIADAIRETGANNISYACNSKTHIAGKSENGEPLHWMYYKEYVEKFGEVVKTA